MEKNHEPFYKVTQCLEGTILLQFGKNSYVVCTHTHASGASGPYQTSFVLMSLQACCYVVISGELIMSRYVAESITTDAGRFSHVGLSQLHKKHLAKAYMAKTSCISCYWICYVSAHDWFSRYSLVLCAFTVVLYVLSRCVIFRQGALEAHCN